MIWNKDILKAINELKEMLRKHEEMLGVGSKPGVNEPDPKTPVDKLNELLTKVIGIEAKLADYQKNPNSNFIKSDDITARIILSVLNENIKFIERENLNKESKYLFRNPMIIEYIKTKSGISNEKSKKAFIESGSTLANFALALFDNYNYGKVADRNKRNKKVEKPERPLEVVTNNAMVNLIGLFTENISIKMLDGTPINQYGASYGDAVNYEQFDAEVFKKFLESNEVNVFFSTASYLDINYGTHVSSSPNQQLKKFCNQYIQEHDCKDYFFIAAEKINDEIKESGSFKNGCRLIFDDKSDLVNKLISTDRIRAKEKFSEFLQSGKTEIITATPDKYLLNTVIDKFSKAHKYMKHERFNIQGIGYAVRFLKR